jgi:prepilin-type N-terminal cleavage/methylation domain-containing protein
MSSLIRQLPARAFRRLSDERGFTLIESMMAAALLLIGLMGVMAMADGAARATMASQARDDGINVARKVIEATNSLSYAEVTSASLVTSLQAKPGLADALGDTGWQIQPRKVPYTVQIDLCDIDDPKDGVGSHGATFCPGTPATGTSDANPQDYKNVTATVSWTAAGKTNLVKQSTFVTPRGAADLPMVTSLTSSATIPVTSPSVTQLPFTATTSSVPGGVSWLKDGSTMGMATGAANTWDFTWNINGVMDGDYVIGARPFDGSGAYGAPYYVTVSLNRYAPAAPTNFVAGYNDGTVSSEWLPNKERDVIGYTVKRQQTAPFTGSVTNVNCGTTGSPVYITTKTTCKDADPLPGLPSIDFVSSTKATTNAATSLALSKPAGMQTNDVMIATISAGTNGSSVTPPSGWTAIQDTASSGGSQGMRLAVYYKVVTGSEGSSFSWNLGSTRNASGTITAWRGVDTTNPIDGSANYTGNSGNESYTPSITTTGANRMILLTHGHRSSTTGLTLTTPASTTFRAGERTSSVIHGQYTKLQTSAGSTGTIDPGGACGGVLCVTSISTCAPATCGQWTAAALALRPSSSPISVNYWVVGVDRDPAGAMREGAASNVVNAYAVNTKPNAPSDPTLVVNGNGSRTLNWTTVGSDPDSGDSVAFYRVYRDGVAYDRTNLGTDTSYTDPNRDGGSHTYYLVSVDTHLRESLATASVSG